VERRRGVVVPLIAALTHLVHGGAPEVVEEDIPEGRVGPEVAVLLYRGYVVEDEAAAEAVEVDGEGGRDQRSR
jgi:citrate synthase